MAKKLVTIDGNTAAAHIAYAFSDVAAIYPITPSSPMGEYADLWASTGKENLWGKQVEIMEMQSEAGAAGAVHGSLSAGALTTTFTASQGLLLMIPNMYKIAGEMIPTVFHVSARSLAAQSLSIFGDHSDVMGCRSTGFAMTCASSIQETMDMALVAHLSTLESEIPFLAFFDGFRTSHEYQRVEEISYDDIRKIVDEKYIERFRSRAQRPEHPMTKVAAQNEDVYFQGRETVNKYYQAVPGIVQKYMDKVASITGRQYHLFDYVGAPDATDVVVVMGSAADTFEWVVDYLNAKGAKVGLMKIRLYRPFAVDKFVEVLPKTVKNIAVLDRTKEPGSLGEPLYQDVVTALNQAGRNVEKIIGGRYGLSSKDFTPTHAKSVFDFLASKKSFHGFTVGIEDDVAHTSIPICESIDVTPAGVTSCMFWGLGSDGTVGSNKNSVKIIGDEKGFNAQAYFAYDSKKSGGITISHLRFGDNVKLDMPWLIDHADFVACHNPAYIGRYDMLTALKEGGVFLLNSAIPSDEVFDHLTREMQEQIIKKRIRFFNINALEIARAAGLGSRINTVMQAAFFKIANILPEEEAISLIKKYIKKTFLKKGEDVVNKNWAAVDGASAALVEVKIPEKITKSYEPAPLVPADSDKFTKNVIEKIMHLKGDTIPVSDMSFDGKLPTGTTKLEKRGVAAYVPHWDSTLCIQCNQCVQSCPHAAIRAKQITPEDVAKAPKGFTVLKSNCKNDRNLSFKIQVYPEDCYGCGVCIEACPKNALDFKSLEGERAAGESKFAEYFESLTYDNLDGASLTTVKGLQFKQPLFEFSGACAGCGETPYVKLLSQISGERAIIANATGCSSIYSGTFPTIPYTKRADGRGPAWGNSLFEDNAEYGLGMRLAVDSNRNLLKMKCDALLAKGCSDALKAAIEKCYSLWDETITEDPITAQKEVQALLAKEKPVDDEAKVLLDKIIELQDYFSEKDVIIIGGDGWAYDIGYGGVDHVIASGKNVTVLVLDTEVYSNTGGQASKSTPMAAVAKFANAGKKVGKKNMGFMMMTYGHAYVASVALGYNRLQAQKALQEAVAYHGPSIVFCYAPCINHGINMRYSQVEAKKAVEAGYWPLYRFNPQLEPGKKFTWETKPATADYCEFIKGEVRYNSLYKTNPEHADELFASAEVDARNRLAFYQKCGEMLSETL